MATKRPSKATGRNENVSVKERRQDRYLEAVRNGKTEEEAADIAELSIHTLHKWRYVRVATHLGQNFLEREKAAREDGRRHNSGEFPQFLSFRERHFAYFDVRRGIHPATGMKWVVRATNNWYHTDAVARLGSSNRLVMILPPGHLKTTYHAIERPVYDIMRDRDIRLLAVSRSQEEAKKVLAAVKLRLSDHSYYHEMASLLQAQGDTPVVCPLCTYEGPIPFRPQGRSREADERWGAEGFIVAGRRSGEKDATMEAKGFGSQILGIRSDRIVLDDVQDPQVARTSPKDSQDKLEWLRNTILSRITGVQQLVILGNFFVPDDFAHKVITAQPDWDVVNYPAIRYEEDDKPKLLCPEYWTFGDLMLKRKEVGEEAWFQTWMQAEGGYDAATFKRDALEAALDPGIALGDIPYPVTDVYIGCDPATASGGYCSIVAWGLDRNSKQRYLIDVFNEKGMRNFDNIVDQLLEMARAYQPRKVVIEGNQQQKGLVHSPAFQRGARSLGLRYEIYQTATGAGGRARQSNFDITTIGSLFDGGLITLPGGGTEAQLGKVRAYISQLVEWRTDDAGNSLKHLTKDMVMATLFAESEAFVQANKGRDRPVKIRSQVKPPSWVVGRYGGFRFNDRFGEREPADA